MNLDFHKKDIYRYIYIRNNIVLNGMIKYFKTEDLENMKLVVVQYEQLRSTASLIKDTQMTKLFLKLKTSAEMLRKGWIAKKFDDSTLAWSIYSSNAASLNDLLADRLEAYSTP